MNERDMVQGHKHASAGRTLGMVCLVACVYVGAAIVIVRVQRAASQPDFGRTLTMRACKDVQGIAQRQALWWGSLGLKAEMLYGKYRGV
jgi:hypothetical protein